MGPKVTQAEGFILGVGAKMFTIAGLGIAYGIWTSAVYRLMDRFAHNIAKTHPPERRWMCFYFHMPNCDHSATAIKLLKYWIFPDNTSS